MNTPVPNISECSLFCSVQALDNLTMRYCYIKNELKTRWTRICKIITIEISLSCSVQSEENFAEIDCYNHIKTWRYGGANRDPRPLKSVNKAPNKNELTTKAETISETSTKLSLRCSFQVEENFTKRDIFSHRKIWRDKGAKRGNPDPKRQRPR